MSRNWDSGRLQIQSQMQIQSSSQTPSKASPSCRGKVKSKKLDNGKELCGYVHRVCLQNKLEGSNFCIRHILGDRSAPFKQCSFVHPHSGKRCPNAARRTERRDSTLCPWHVKKLYLKRKRSQLQTQNKSRNLNAKSEIDTLMKELEHFCPQDHDKSRLNKNWDKQDDDSTTASEYLRQKIGDAAARLNDDSDEDSSNNPVVDDVLRLDLIDSDSESLDSDQEEPLKHASVFTSEEKSLILRDKMLRLQSLYIEQFKHLHHLLKEKWRKYLLSLKTEKDCFASVNGDVDAAELKIYEDLKSLIRYHSYHGAEILLKRQAKEKRKAVTESENYKPPVYQTCIYIKEDEPCNNRSLPLSHYCKIHILYDVHQVLFRPCAASSPPCLNPVVSFSRRNTCVLHTDLKADQNSVKRMGKEDEAPQIGTSTAEPELFRTMDDIASLSLDAVVPGSLFTLDQFGDLGSSDLLQ